MPAHRPCPNGHAYFTFILLDKTRLCACSSCGAQWSVHLGGGSARGESETDGIPNARMGLEHLEELTRRRARAAAAGRAS